MAEPTEEELRRRESGIGVRFPGMTDSPPPAPAPQEGGVAPAAPSWDDILTQLESRAAPRPAEDSLPMSVAKGALGAANALVEPLARPAIAFNDRLADALGVPADLAGAALSLVDADFREKGESGADAVRRAFAKVGVRAEKVGGLAQRMGEVAFDTALSTFIMGKAAPAVEQMTRGATSTLGQLANRTAASINQAPATFRTSAALSVPGQAVGGLAAESTVSEPYKPLARFVGEVVGGGATGEIGTAMARGVGARFGTQQAGTPDRGRLNAEFPKVRTPDTAVTGEVADPVRIAQFAEEETRTQLRAIDDGISRIVRDIYQGPDASSGELAARMRTQIHALRENVRDLERAAYAAIQNEQVPVDPELSDAMTRVMQFGGFGRNWTPDNILNQLLERATNPLTNPNGPATLSVDEIRRFRTAIREARMETRGSSLMGTAPNEQLNATLTMLDQALLEALDQRFPGNAAYVQARAISQDLHARFDQGGLGELFLLTGRNEARVPYEDTLETLMKDPQGLSRLADAMRPLAFSPAHPQAHNIHRLLARDVRADTEETIRRAFQEVVQDAVGQRVGNVASGDQVESAASRAAASSAAQQYRRWEPLIRRYTRVHTDLATAALDMNALILQRTEAERSLLARFMRGNPQAELNRVLAAPNAPELIRDLQAQFTQDLATVGQSRAPWAAEAFKGLVLQEFLKQGGGRNVKAAFDRLNDPKWSGVLEGVLTPREMDRLRNILLMGTRIQDDLFDTKGEKVLKWGTSMLTRILGLKAGAAIANLTSAGSAGSLSIPSRLARQSTEFVEGLWDRIDDGMGAVSRAVLSPEVETLLIRRNPQDIKAQEALFKTMQRTIMRETVALNQMNRYIADTTIRATRPYSAEEQELREWAAAGGGNLPREARDLIKATADKGEGPKFEPFVPESLRTREREAERRRATVQQIEEPPARARAPRAPDTTRGILP